MPTPSNLRQSSYFVLGLVRLGLTSGYAIKQAAELATQHFFATSRSQIYPELARLADAELVTRDERPRGNRARSRYGATHAGNEALIEWLRSPNIAPPQYRDEGSLRMLFADALAADEQLVLLRRLRDRERDMQAHLETMVRPLADSAQEAGLKFPGAVGQLGADIHRFVADWLEGLIVDLEREAHALPAE